MSAQLLKTIFTFIATKKLNLERMVGAGGMPSAHSALVCSLTVAIARTVGVSSPEFALAFLVARVVMYDAMGVRRETGDQGKVINDILRIFEDMGKPISPEKKFKELVGHTPLQVVCGAALGIAVGCALMQL